eukprot:7011078-Pyramimonas_sp.AAC.1
MALQVMHPMGPCNKALHASRVLKRGMRPFVGKSNAASRMLPTKRTPLHVKANLMDLYESKYKRVSTLDKLKDDTQHALKAGAAGG